MSKITTTLAILALVASALPFNMPVEAGPNHDVYIKEIVISKTAPTEPSNISLFAVLYGLDVLCTNITVNFTYYNGTDQPTFLMSAFEPGPVPSWGSVVKGYWNSTLSPPDITKNYTLRITATMTGDTNTTNNTLDSNVTINWKSSILNLTGMTGNAAAYKGDEYPIGISLTNIGNAPFSGVEVLSVHNGIDIVADTTFNCTTSPFTVGMVAYLGATITKETTLGFTAGVVNLSLTLGLRTIWLNVTFKDKITNVSVTSLSFDPASSVVKATQNVTITAGLKNTGSKDAIDMPVLFWFNETVIMECDNRVLVATGGTNTTTCVWQIPASDITTTYNINVTPDPFNATGKGWLEKELIVLPAPRFVLGISDMTFDPTTLVVKENVGDTQDLKVTVTVNNSGDLDVKNAVLKLDAGQGKIIMNSSVNIGAGGQTVVTLKIPVSTPENDTQIKITADLMKGGMSVYFSKNITVPGDIDRPDYDITELLIAPIATQERGLDTVITVKVKNIGDALGKNITLQFWANGTVFAAKSMYNLSAGEDNLTALVWPIPSVFSPLGKIDINVSIVDYPAYKHIYYNIIELKKPRVIVDFAKDKNGKVKSYSSSATSGKSKTLMIKVTLQNLGSADAKDLKLIIYDSNHKELANGTDITVPMGHTISVAIPIKFKSGTSIKIMAVIIYNGVHAIPGLDKGLTAASPVTDMPTVRVSKTTPGFEAVLLVGALAVALVVLSRRKK